MAISTAANTSHRYELKIGMSKKRIIAIAVRGGLHTLFNILKYWTGCRCQETRIYNHSVDSLTFTKRLVINVFEMSKLHILHSWRWFVLAWPIRRSFPASGLGDTSLLTQVSRILVTSVMFVKKPKLKSKMRVWPLKSCPGLLPDLSSCKPQQGPGVKRDWHCASDASDGK